MPVVTLTGKISDIEIRLADGHDPGSVDRVYVPAPERAPKRLVEHRLTAEATDHHRRGDLALAKARDPHFATERFGRLLDAALDLLGWHLRVDAYA